MWSDNESEVDLLGFSVHKDLIRELVTDKTLLPLVNSRTLMYQPCAANMYQKNRRTHCETLRLV